MLATKEWVKSLLIKAKNSGKLSSTTTTVTPDGDTYITNNTYVYNQSNIFSTEEKVFGRWTDGKPAYRKVINIIPTNTSNTVNVASLNIDTLIEMACILDGSQFLATYINGNINYECTSDQVNKNGQIILVYTKGSDAQNSYDPSSVEGTTVTEEEINDTVDEIMSELENFNWEDEE